MGIREHCFHSFFYSNCLKRGIQTFNISKRRLPKKIVFVSLENSNLDQVGLILYLGIELWAGLRPLSISSH